MIIRLNTDSPTKSQHNSTKYRSIETLHFDYESEIHRIPDKKVHHFDEKHILTEEINARNPQNIL